MQTQGSGFRGWPSCHAAVRLGELSDAVHTCAPGLPVRDAGKIKSKNARVEGR